MFGNLARASQRGLIRGIREACTAALRAPRETRLRVAREARAENERGLVSDPDTTVTSFSAHLAVDR